MKNILLVAATALALTTTTSFAESGAENFDNNVASVTANVGRYSLSVKGTEDNGFTQFGVNANVLAYGMSDNLSSALDVYGTWYRSNEQIGLGADYIVTYAVNDLSVYGVANIEYVADERDFSAGDFFTAPTLGASYQMTDKVGAYTEVSYAWNVSDDFSEVGGEVELGANIALADNITLNPALVRTFDTAEDTTQLHVGLAFNF